MSRTTGQPSPAPTAVRIRRWLPGLILVVATFIAYLPVWRAGFVMDDDVFLLNNPLVKQVGGLGHLWFTTAAEDYFPLTSSTLWLEWRLWDGHALGYHLVNVLLHALSAVLWWRVLARLLPQCRSGAWLAAALFALHPVNVESVAWITERKNTLAMFFQALTLVAYLRFEDSSRRRWYWTALGTFILALLSKTAVAPLPLVLLGLAWWRRCGVPGSVPGRVEPAARSGQIQPKPFRPQAERYNDGQTSCRVESAARSHPIQPGPVRLQLWRTLPFFAVAAALGLVTVWFQYHRAIGPEIVRTDSFGSRLAGAGWAVWFYLYKIVVPLNLIFVYPRWRIDAGNVVSYLPGLLALAGLFWCWCRRRQWGKAWLFAMGYFGVMLLPVLGFLNISFMRYSLVADRWQYFAIIGPLALVAAFLMSARDEPAGAPTSPDGPGSRAKGRTVRPTALGTTLGGMLLLVLGMLTWRQCGRYADSETLWRATLARNPECSIAHLNLGNALLHHGQVEEAMTHYGKALEIRPDDADAHYNLANVLFETGRMDEAIVHYQKALEIRPAFSQVHNNLGNVLFQKGQVREAIAHYQQSLQLRPDNAEAHNNLGFALVQIGQLDGAIAEYQKAVDLRPDFAQAHYNLAIVLHQTGRLREAMTQYQKSLALQPENPDAANNLAWLLATSPEAALRNGVRAIELAQQADRLAGNKHPLVLRTLAAAYAEAGRLSEAVATAQQALQLATAQTNTALADTLRMQIGLYQTGLPFHESGLTNAP